MFSKSVSCERCGTTDNVVTSHLTVQLDGGMQNEAQFRLCLPCQREGRDMEPLESISDFLTRVQPATEGM